jgi:hypothetical protein
VGVTGLVAPSHCAGGDDRVVPVSSVQGKELRGICEARCAYWENRGQ